MMCVAVYVYIYQCPCVCVCIRACVLMVAPLEDPIVPKTISTNVYDVTYRKHSS